MKECCEKWEKGAWYYRASKKVDIKFCPECSSPLNGSKTTWKNICPRCGRLMGSYCSCSKDKQKWCSCNHQYANRLEPLKCQNCQKPIKPKGIEELVDLNRNSLDIQSNDDLFNLILEQRFKINEIIRYLKEG